MCCNTHGITTHQTNSLNPMHIKPITNTYKRSKLLLLFCICDHSYVRQRDT